jgi:hypothetical protein
VATFERFRTEEGLSPNSPTGPRAPPPNAPPERGWDSPGRVRIGSGRKGKEKKEKERQRSKSRGLSQVQLLTPAVLL